MKYIFTLFCFLILPKTVFSQELSSSAYVEMAISCSGKCDASITVAATGGVAPYTYSINDFFTASDTFTNLCSGNYDVVVKDSEGITSIVTLSILEPAPLVGTLTYTSSSANTANGVIEINASGGTQPFVYSIDGIIFQNLNIFSNLLSGTYNVSVQDANGCLFSDTIIIDEIVELSSTATVTDVWCNGGCDASITVAATGGVAPYTYSINDFFTASNTFTNLCSGNYDVVVKDSQGITTSSILSILEPAPLVGALMQISSSSANAANGVIEIIATGGILPYTYSIDGFIFQFHNIFSNLLSGTYNVSVRDANGCLFSNTIIIDEIVELSSTATVTDVNCNGGCDASITVAAIGGVAPYTYSINDFFTASNTFTNLCSGNYDVVVTDSQGIITSRILSISEPAPITLEITNILPSANTANGVIEIIASGGRPPYMYSIDRFIFQSQNIFSDIPAGTYEIEVQDSNGCYLINTIVIDQINVDNTVVINGDILTPNLEADTYQWINAETQTIIDGATNRTFKAEQTGRYRVEMTITEPNAIAKQAKVAKTISVSSPIYQVTVLGINNNTFNTLKVIPNPADAYLILPTTSINKNYSIYTVLGQKIVSGKIINKELSIERLSKGLYYLNIEEHGTSKFIKN